jgi:glycosyltransferase involved in cell wall biosynthesis
MRIAFISYEAPPDMLLGGIGTYVGQAARTLAARGHEVEVFTASPKNSGELNDSYMTHLLKSSKAFEDRLEFPRLAGKAFAKRHAEKPFHVLEGPEFLAEAAMAKKLVPEIPLVVKLHMSMTLIRQLNSPAPNDWQKFKNQVKATLQPAVRLKRWKEFDYPKIERSHLLEADVISAPCRAIADVTAEMWHLDRDRMIEVPYPFTPPRRLLDIPVKTKTDTVGFIGRLEQRKGVIDLARAIPLILRRFPETNFIFAGQSIESPVSGVGMQDFLVQLLGSAKSRVCFPGKIEPDRMDEIFRQMDITVLPSLWENFPNACLEAMAAGRGVVGSSAGGMAQQLDEGNAGLLIPPKNPEAIAEAVCTLLGNPFMRQDLGRKARERVLSEYNADRVGFLMEQSYNEAIRQRKAGVRPWQAA